MLSWWRGGGEILIPCNRLVCRSNIRLRGRLIGAVRSVMVARDVAVARRSLGDQTAAERPRRVVSLLRPSSETLLPPPATDWRALADQDYRRKHRSRPLQPPAAITQPSPGWFTPLPRPRPCPRLSTIIDTRWPVGRPASWMKASEALRSQSSCGAWRGRRQHGMVDGGRSEADAVDAGHWSGIRNARFVNKTALNVKMSYCDRYSVKQRGRYATTGQQGRTLHHKLHGSYCKSSLCLSRALYLLLISVLSGEFVFAIDENIS